jgi:hypothetical protein
MGFFSGLNAEKYDPVVSPILFKHHIWLFLENQNTIYGGHFLKNFA